MPGSSEAERSRWPVTCTPGRRLAGHRRGKVRVLRRAGGRRDTADAKSVLSVMGIGATSGQVVTVRATGPDADEAVAAITEILADATPVGG